MSQMQNLVSLSWERPFGGNTISKVESQCFGTDNMAFLPYSASFANEKNMHDVLLYSTLISDGKDTLTA
jgi:hypothetical protein